MEVLTTLLSRGIMRSTPFSFIIFDPNQPSTTPLRHFGWHSMTLYTGGPTPKGMEALLRGSKAFMFLDLDDVSSHKTNQSL